MSIHSLLFKTAQPLRAKTSATYDIGNIPLNFDCILCLESHTSNEYITHRYKKRTNEVSIQRYLHCKKCRATTYKHLNSEQLAEAMIGVIINKLIDMGTQHTQPIYLQIAQLIPSRKYASTYTAISGEFTNPTILKKEVIKAFTELLRVYHAQFPDIISRYERLRPTTDVLVSEFPSPPPLVRQIAQSTLHFN